MTLNRLADLSHCRVKLHRALYTECSRLVIRQDTDEHAPSSIFRRAVVDDLGALKVLMTVEYLGGGFGSTHGVPVSNATFHDETDFGVVDPFPECDILVGDVCRKLLLCCQVKCLKLSTGCVGVKRISTSIFTCNLATSLTL